MRDLLGGALMVTVGELLRTAVGKVVLPDGGNIGGEAIGDTTGAAFGTPVGVEIGKAKRVATGGELCGGTTGCGLTGDTTGAASTGVEIGTAEEDANGAVATAVGGITSKIGAEELGKTSAGEVTGDTGGREGKLFDITGESVVGTTTGRATVGVFCMGAAGKSIGLVVGVSTIYSDGCLVGV